jgi:hypothetical protein
MSVDTKGLIVLEKKDGEVVSEHIVMAAIMDSLNAMIEKSYLDNGLDKLEANSFGTILTKAKVSEFSYKPFIWQDKAGEDNVNFSFNTRFAYFIPKDEYNNSNSHFEFNGSNRSEKIENAYNEGRTMFLNPFTSDYIEHTDKPVLSMSLGKWGKSEKIIATVLSDVSDRLGLANFYCAADYTGDYIFTDEPKAKKVKSKNKYKH